jgi:hypothetical protein
MKIKATDPIKFGAEVHQVLDRPKGEHGVAIARTQIHIRAICACESATCITWPPSSKFLPLGFEGRHCPGKPLLLKCYS